MQSRGLLFLAVALFGMGPIACGSSGGRTGTGGTSGSSGGGTDGGGGRAGTGGKAGGADAGIPDITWIENGVLRTATYPSLATRHTTTASDTFNFVGADVPANATVSFAVSSQATLDGTYACGADGGTIATLSYDNVVTTVQSCSLAVTFTTSAAGQPRATGTFEAVVVIPAGTKTLTEGHFDVAVMPL